MESFFGTLKTECLHHFKFKTRDQARQVVFDYIEVFYNRIRRHATIQNQVPADYANQFYKNELQIAAQLNDLPVHSIGLSSSEEDTEFQSPSITRTQRRARRISTGDNGTKS